jgi:signal transduction histidine kinase
MSASANLALLCDEHGNISQILRNSFGNAISLETGMPFARLAAGGSLSKGLSFITEINANSAAFDWEINIQIGELVKTIHFTGGKVGEQLLVVGAENGKFSLQLYEEMIHINNEQTNALRAALKENSTSTHTDPGQAQFDEISRLNNDLVAMQRELAKKNAELAHLNALKNQFLGMAAHDLRNPLQGIMTYSEFLLEDISARLDPSQIEFLTTIHDQSHYMANLVNDLLDVATIESGNLHLDLQPVDLGLLAQHCISHNQLIASRKKVLINLEADPVPPALLDAPKIEQVLVNLLTNAIKFSPPGSAVKVYIRCSEEKILVSVHDEGPGIPAEQMAHLFQPFQRGQKGTAGEKSTGLGLTIVKRIVEGHGGTIWPECLAGAGTTFFLSIPIHIKEGLG